MFESKAQKARREECRPFGAQILSQSYPGLTPLGSASCGSSSLHDDCGMLPSLLHPTKRKLCSSGGGGGNRTTSICSSSQRPEGPTEAEPSGASPGKMWRFDMSPGGRAHPAIVIKQQRPSCRKRPEGPKAAQRRHYVSHLDSRRTGGQPSRNRRLLRGLIEWECHAQRSRPVSPVAIEFLQSS